MFTGIVSDIGEIVAATDQAEGAAAAAHRLFL